MWCMHDVTDITYYILGATRTVYICLIDVNRIWNSPFTRGQPLTSAARASYTKNNVNNFWMRATTSRITLAATIVDREYRRCKRWWSDSLLTVMSHSRFCENSHQPGIIIKYYNVEVTANMIQMRLQVPCSIIGSIFANYVLVMYHKARLFFSTQTFKDEKL